MADCSCILCNESAEGLKNKRIKLTDKGSRGIRKASKERGESALMRKKGTMYTRSAVGTTA